MTISLITPAQLKSLVNANGEKICLVDARSRAEYNANHLPGAIYMGWEDWTSKAPEHLGPMLKQPGYWGEMCEVDPAEVGKQLELLGLSNASHIVVYADGAKSKGREGRIAWMMLYLGATRVSVMNGGYSGWLGEGNSVDTFFPKVDPGRFNIQEQPERRMKFGRLRQACVSGNMPIMLDTRSILEHIGDLHRYMPRRGRIPNSEFIAYSSIFNPDGTFVNKESYLALLPEKVANAEDVVVYCEVGARASMVSLLHELYTGHVLPVYDGSMMQWCADHDLPVEKLSNNI
jgi:thiosulfate/3-mercaptopyruvate sulfurtransferase